ncbi:MAG: TIGR02206 family membrane protein [Firmicutes bacterium]|nr:TIGR02206 family membrane protein [Bacillota bacterium]
MFSDISTFLNYFTFDYFFSGPDDVPEDALWHAYGWQHFLWLIVMGLIIFFSCRAFRKADYKTQTKVLRGVAIFILIQEIVKDILFWYAGLITVEHLPLHFCGISIFFSLWYAFKPNELNAAYVYGMSMPGALCALIFPNWTNFPLIHFSSINSFTIHAELILFALLAVTSGRLVPNIKKIPKLFAVIVAMAIPIYFLNKAWGTNFMFISDPSPGSPLMPLYDMFGDGYVIAAAVLLLIVWVIIFLPWRRRSQHQ